MESCRAGLLIQFSTALQVFLRHKVLYLLNKVVGKFAMEINETVLFAPMKTPGKGRFTEQ